MTPRVAEGGAGGRATAARVRSKGKHSLCASSRRPAPRAAFRRALPLLLVFVVSLAPTIPASAADRSTPVAAGDAAPEITLRDQHGRAFALADVLKQRAFVVLAFYPKAFTSG